ncbi:MAG: ROK family protein [Chloroflexota bacterium]
MKPIIGVDVGGTKIAVALARHDGTIIERSKRRTKAELGPEGVIHRIAETIQQTLDSADMTPKQFLAVGLGMPGPLNPDKGIIYHTPNLPGWKNVPVADLLSSELNLPVYLENDVNVGTMGEHALGAGIGTQDMVGIFVGTGIGGGVILGGKLHSGHRSGAGELGHMVVAAGGPYCGCGRQGCIEAVASRTAVVRAIKAGVAAGRTHKLSEDGEMPERITSGTIARAWERKCPLTREIISRTQWYLGLHAASIINMIDPEMLVYGGGLVEAFGDAFLKPLIATAKQYMLQHTGPETRIVTAKLGDDAGTLGAAVMARQRIS